MLRCFPSMFYPQFITTGLNRGNTDRQIFLGVVLVYYLPTPLLFVPANWNRMIRRKTFNLHFWGSLSAENKHRYPKNNKKREYLTNFSRWLMTRLHVTGTWSVLKTTALMSATRDRIVLIKEYVNSKLFRESV